MSNVVRKRLEPCLCTAADVFFRNLSSGHSKTVLGLLKKALQHIFITLWGAGRRIAGEVLQENARVRRTTIIMNEIHNVQLHTKNIVSSCALAVAIILNTFAVRIIP